MKARGPIVAVIILVLILIGLSYAATHANISALPDPGPLETSSATKLRSWLIARASHAIPPPSIPDSADAISKGDSLYGMDCASCHGRDGRNPAPIGRSMYPRVPDLGSPMVQSLSNREIFWVIKNGIRLSGMPGFAQINTDRETWQLVYYVRSLNPEKKQSSSILRSQAGVKYSRP